MVVAKAHRTEPRRDALPEYVDWKDTGCQVHPLCRACPLQVCVHDLPHGLMDLNTERRREQILQLRDAGKKPREIAEALGIHEQTVFRVLRRENR